MGLASLILFFPSRALWTGGEHFDRAARFWTKLFVINFAFGVVTGIPLEFQFGTNWAKFSTYGGGVIGQTLAMEGVFAFFLESFFLGALLFGYLRPSECFGRSRPRGAPHSVQVERFRTDRCGSWSAEFKVDADSRSNRMRKNSWTASPSRFIIVNDS
jgi:Cytochrome bd terminal oxidase subunit I